MSSSIVHLKGADIFQQDHLVLKNVNLNINKGEFVYLIGKTGSGKSSLLKTLYGEIKLAKGEGTVGEFNLTRLKRRKIPFLRRKIGIVFQDFQLLTDRSVNKNLQFVLKATGWRNKKEINERMQFVLEKVGLATKGFKMPHQLSGGEQQRVSIARALLNDPDLILADEPTGNLDPETTAGIMNLLFDISKSNRAILMATHDYQIMEKYPARTVKCEAETVLEATHPTTPSASTHSPD